jgi:glycerol kinase
MPSYRTSSHCRSFSRFLVFESDTGELVTSHQIEVQQLFPQGGWVEMDPNEIYSTCLECIERACESLEALGITVDEIKAVGIANQRETSLVWDKSTGEPLHNAIVWLDTRTSELAKEYIEKTPNKDKDHFKAKTGLPIHPYFSALKLKWLLNQGGKIEEAHREGNLLFGTVDSWLIWKLTGDTEHVTDVTNASRTLLLDLHKRKWSTELCDFFEIPMDILPEIRSSAEVYGYIHTGVLKGVPLSGCLGDQQSAMVGHNCLQTGDAKSTYGTGTFLLCNTGTRAIPSKNGLLCTVGFQFGANAPVCYALEGSGSIGGNVVRFLRDNLGMIKEASEIEELASAVEDTNDVCFVPCFTGLYTPYWDSTARGIICGLTQCANKKHIARAALQAVAFQTVEMIEAVEQDLDGQASVHMLKIDGGMTANKLFNQLQANALGKPIVCSKMAEISGWGAAVAAGIGVRQISLEQFRDHRNQQMEQYKPNNTEKARKAEFSRWREALKRAQGWAPVI